MTWDFPYVKPESNLPPIPPRSSLVGYDPLTWRNWYNASYATTRTAGYPTDYYYKPSWFNPAQWQCSDASCGICHPNNRDPKKYLTDYWQGYLKSSDSNYSTWWAQHWPYFYGYHNYWYYPSTA